ncbi:MAG TPA: hypothetical protein VKA85_05725 [Candidatus Limnocylindrales bacterium]|nr:hypothetical protein [Candidatus Limnocylindrales bacterium]
MTDDRQPLVDEDRTLPDPADKDQPAEGGREEAEDGDATDTEAAAD